MNIVNVAEARMSRTHYEPLPLGTLLVFASESPTLYLKVGGWGRYVDSLLLDLECHKLSCPEAVILFIQDLEDFT